MEMENEEDIVIEEEKTGHQELVKKLREKLKKCEEEKAEYLSGWQRTRADFVNARREEEENRKDFLKFAEKNLTKEMLVFIDSFDRMLGNADEWQKLDKNWQAGIKNIYSQIMNILQTHGVEQIKSRGEPFNPEKHESVEEIEVGELEKDGIIIEEARKGYRMHEKILRPAQVKVGKYNKK
jgi:molecular chaperone GrpE